MKTRASIGNQKLEEARLKAAFDKIVVVRQRLAQQFDASGNLRGDPSHGLFKRLQTSYEVIQSAKAAPISRKINKRVTDPMLAVNAKQLKTALVALVGKANEVAAAGVDGDLTNAKLHSLVLAYRATQESTSANAECVALIAQVAGIVPAMFERFKNYVSTCVNTDLQPCDSVAADFIEDLKMCCIPTSPLTVTSSVRRPNGTYTQKKVMTLTGAHNTWYVDCGACKGPGKVWYLQNEKDCFFADSSLYKLRLEWRPDKVVVFEYSTSAGALWLEVGYFKRGL